jgi:hypothetical protein
MRVHVRKGQKKQSKVCPCRCPLLGLLSAPVLLARRCSQSPRQCSRTLYARPTVSSRLRGMQFSFTCRVPWPTLIDHPPASQTPSGRSPTEPELHCAVHTLSNLAVRGLVLELFRKSSLFEQANI